MYCTNCGTELIDGVCPKCQEEEASAQTQARVIYVKEKPKREPNSAKIFSIISLATGILGLLGYTYPYFSIAAIVFGALYKSKMGKDCSLTKAGKILGIVGLVVNTLILIVTTVVSAIVAAASAIFSFAWTLALCFGYIEEFYNFIMSYVSYLI